MGSGRFRFGLFEFDSATQELWREGVLVRLQAQPAQVLGMLVDHAGQVVSREELRQAVWGADTFVDFERGLNFCISQVRSVLKDDSTEPRFIRTVPKQGYQFIAPIERLPAAGNGAQTSALLRPAQNRMAMMALAVVILAAIGVLSAIWLRPKQAAAHAATPNPPIVAVLRFDNETGNPAIDRFSDGLTDNVIEQLTSAASGRYAVIGNAQILRQPRNQRDLRAIGASLNAKYIVLGQVQADGTQVRILIHLIRLPEQTHLGVVRVERALADPLNLEGEIANKVGVEFSSRVAADPPRPASQSSASH
jgi:DNA-binding winged helix-turn-helix (wHTH) protein/TolB-like protein